MWAWLKFLANVVYREYPVDTVTVISTDTTRCTVSRLGDSINLLISLTGKVEKTGERAEVKITLSDPKSIRELSALLLNLAPKVEPPG